MIIYIYIWFIKVIVCYSCLIILKPRRILSIGGFILILLLCLAVLSVFGKGIGMELDDIMSLPKYIGFTLIGLK